MRIGIIGAGAVGSACLTAVLMRGIALEVVVLNRDRKRARGLVMDIQYGAVLSPAAEVRDGDYPDLAGASLVMITAGSTKGMAAPLTAKIRRGDYACSTPISQSFRRSSAAACHSA